MQNHRQLGVAVLLIAFITLRQTMAPRPGGPADADADHHRRGGRAAIRAVAGGQSTFDATVTARLVAGLRASGSGPTPAPGTADLTASLNRREKDVLRLIGAGPNTVRIADHLFVSTATVKTHINYLFA